MKFRILFLVAFVMVNFVGNAQCDAGQASASSVVVDLNTGIEFTSTNFNVSSGYEIAWVLTPEDDGPATSSADVMAANADGRVFIGDTDSTLSLDCSQLIDFEDGNYYATPFIVEAIDFVLFSPADGCLYEGELCINNLSGSNYSLDQIYIIAPDGTLIDPIAEFADQAPVPVGYPLTSSLIDLLPSFLPGGLCFDLADLYSGDPNGEWLLQVENSGSGTFSAEIEPFTVSFGDCAISSPQTISIDGVNGSFPTGISTESLFVPSNLEDFPTINSACEAYGIAVLFEKTCGNPYVDFSAFMGCDSLTVDFETTYSDNLFINPINSVEWDFADGSPLETGMNVSHFFSSAGTYVVAHDIILDEFYVSEVNIQSEQVGDGFLQGGADFSGTISSGNSTATLAEIEDDDSPSWSIDMPIKGDSIYLSFLENDVTMIGPLPIGDYEDAGTYEIAFSGNAGAALFGSSSTGVSGSIVIQRRIMDTIHNFVTIIVQESVAPVVTNLTGVDTICSNDSIILSSSEAASYQWYLDDVAISGETSQTFTAHESGNYSVIVVDSGVTCFSAPTYYELHFLDIDVPVIGTNSTGLTVDNDNGYNVQWFTNGVPIPGATTETLTDLSSGGPFTVSFTSADGCEATSDAFETCLAGTSSADGTTLSLGTDVQFTADGFVLSSTSAVAWAVSTEANGPITDMTSLQTSIDNGWVYPSEGVDSLLLSCGDFSGGNGEYYMTPFSSQFFDAACVPDGNFCLDITGSDWLIVGSSLTFTFPDGSVVGILDELVPPEFQGLIPDTIDPGLLALLPTLLPDGLCFNLSDLYQGDPNGDWTISAENVGTGTVTVSIPAFEIGVYAANCSSVSQDEVTQIDALTASIAPNSTNSLTVTISAQSFSAPFPTVETTCSVFGDATAFTVDCGTAIEDVFDVASFNLYPNPNDGLFSINMDVKEMNDVKIQIVDMTGRLVMNRTVPSVYGSFTETFDLKNNLSSGVYVFNLQVGDYQVQKRFIVQ